MNRCVLKTLLPCFTPEQINLQEMTRMQENFKSVPLAPYIARKQFYALKWAFFWKNPLCRYNALMSNRRSPHRMDIDSREFFLPCQPQLKLLLGEMKALNRTSLRTDFLKKPILEHKVASVRTCMPLTVYALINQQFRALLMVVLFLSWLRGLIWFKAF